MADRVVTIPFKPHKEQSEIISDLARFTVLICHRRFGKTVLAVNWLVRKAMEDGDKYSSPWRGAYLAPLLKQAKSVAWDYLKFYAGTIPGVKFNEAELRADLPNGSRISLYGADSYEALRGLYFMGLVLDEVAQMPMSAWTKVLRPALADHRGWGLFLGTPQGKNALYDFWNSAPSDPEWARMMYKASQTDLVDPEELDSARKTMDADEYEQEFECSFTAAIRGAYYGHLMTDADEDKRITDVPYDPTLLVSTVWDLGVSDSTSIWFVQAGPGGKYAVIDYYEATGEGLPHYAKVLNKKGYDYEQHIAPHDARVRELGSGKSRIETAMGLGINFTVAPNIPVQDGINAVRNIIPRCWFDRSKCAVGIEALRHYRREFNEKMGDFKDNPRHDWASHAADAFRYFAVGYRPVIQVDVSRLQREGIG